jgi:hypothetical protein
VSHSTQVVTRTGFAQGLVQLAGKLPGFGLTDIVQSLYVDDNHPGEAYKCRIEQHCQLAECNCTVASAAWLAGCGATVLAPSLLAMRLLAQPVGATLLALAGCGATVLAPSLGYV